LAIWGLHKDDKVETSAEWVYQINHGGQTVRVVHLQCGAIILSRPLLSMYMLLPSYMLYNAI